MREADVSRDLGQIHLVNPVQGQDEIRTDQLRHGGIEAAQNGQEDGRVWGRQRAGWRRKVGICGSQQDERAFTTKEALLAK